MTPGLRIGHRGVLEVAFASARRVAGALYELVRTAAAVLATFEKVVPLSSGLRCEKPAVSHL